jgi:hypothetical protein
VEKNIRAELLRLHLLELLLRLLPEKKDFYIFPNFLPKEVPELKMLLL